MGAYIVRHPATGKLEGQRAERCEAGREKQEENDGSREAPGRLREEEAAVEDLTARGAEGGEKREGRGRDACCVGMRRRSHGARARWGSRAGDMARMCEEHIGPAISLKKRYNGEFDSGSERTLAAWIRHASRTEGHQACLGELSGARVSNT